MRTPLKTLKLSVQFILQIYDDDEYDDEEALRPLRDPIDDYYRDDAEQPMATSTERQQQEMTSSTTKRYSPSNTLDDLQKNIESNIGLTTLFNLDGDSTASSAMPPSFGPQFPTADPMATAKGDDESEVFAKQRYVRKY